MKNKKELRHLFLVLENKKKLYQERKEEEKHRSTSKIKVNDLQKKTNKQK
jgi:hypothetical protein